MTEEGERWTIWNQPDSSPEPEQTLWIKGPPTDPIEVCPASLVDALRAERDDAIKLGVALLDSLPEDQREARLAIMRDTLGAP